MVFDIVPSALERNQVCRPEGTRQESVWAPGQVPRTQNQPRGQGVRLPLSPHVLNRRESLLLCHLTCAEGVTQAKEKGRIAELSYNAGLSGGTRAVPSHAPTTVPLSLAAPSFHSRHWDGKSEVCLPLILLGSLFPAQGLQPWLSDLTWPCCGRDPISGRVAWPCG